MASTTQTILLNRNAVFNIQPESDLLNNNGRNSRVSKVILKKNPINANSNLPLIEQTFPLKLVWRNIIFFVYLHIAAVYGAELFFTNQIMWQTVLWGVLLTYATGLSITAGCHRLWAHKSYKAKRPLEFMLILFQTIGFQNSVWEWCRDHRLHHKYSETNADPHNVNRGFFFAHMGWLLCRKHPSVREKGKGMDMSDLESDPMIMFQKKYYVPLMIIFCFIFPTVIPMYFWGETFSNSWFFATQLRFCFSLHATWLVNSAAHLWGSKPYNQEINPSENRFVSLFALGEGWHNYHHTFPWDYKTAELGNYQFNLTCAFIDLMAKLGLASDLKTVDKAAVLKRAQRTGDGSHPGHHHHVNGPWGWGDTDIPGRDIRATQILN